MGLFFIIAMVPGTTDGGNSAYIERKEYPVALSFKIIPDFPKIMAQRAHDVKMMSY